MHDFRLPVRVGLSFGDKIMIQFDPGRTVGRMSTGVGLHKDPGSCLRRLPGIAETLLQHIRHVVSEFFVSDRRSFH